MMMLNNNVGFNGINFIFQLHIGMCVCRLFDVYWRHPRTSHVRSARSQSIVVEAV